MPHPLATVIEKGKFSCEYEDEDEHEGYDDGTWSPFLGATGAGVFGARHTYATRYDNPNPPQLPVNQGYPRRPDIPYPQQPSVNRDPRQYPRIRVQPNGEGIPRRFNKGLVRVIESHIRPYIANNPSPVVIPEQQGRSFEVTPHATQNLPKYHGLATEEPYLHLAAYDARCNQVIEVHC